jgi:cytochrome c-type biogenesis protein CcmF
MIPMLGRNLILLSLLAATAGAILGFASARSRSETAALWTRLLAYIYSAAIIGANLLMVYALVARDFSVHYVSQVGSRAVPTWVAVSSLWSSLEGSILFWGAVLGVCIGSATLMISRRYAEYAPAAIGVWLAVAAFFSFLISGPAQPFGTVSPIPLDGPGPNPLLQNHILMAAHPPMLYLGFVGMTIPFGLAAAALMVGRLGHDFLKPLRQWLLLPWIFLTVSIVLGGWWAYEVLGWGGYWAWDPVENASFLPWLTATAALHSAIVMERRGTLKAWTTTLILATFLLTILGTFMTRSGVFNSVHSFTQSSIGPILLGFFAVGLLFSVFLLATRVDTLTSDDSGTHPTSREGIFMVNNLLFVLFTFTVLIGTVFPLVVEATTGRQISVGRPYFDKMAVPIGAALLLMMGIGPALPWGKASRKQLVRALVPPLAGGLVIMALGVALGARNWWAILTLLLAGYTGQITFKEMFLPFVKRMRQKNASVGEALVEAQLRRGRRRFGAYIVHAGVAIMILAIAISSTMKQEREIPLSVGQSAEMSGYTLTLQAVEERNESHRDAAIAVVDISRDGKYVTTLTPRMNYYAMSREPIGTPDVHMTFRGDLYLAIMSLNPAGKSAVIHAFNNPMIGWIWISTGIMAFGGVLILVPVGRRRTSESAATAPAAAPLPAGGTQ